MITKLSIKNYQSHTDTVIEPGAFTVLVGPSSAGKSAVTRAIKALASNQTGKDYITHGETTMQVSATTDKGTVVLTKGKPEDSYVILTNEDPKNPRKYTKLGVGVPEDVTNFLGIDPKDAINFAGQFDMPYLLKTSSAEVARTLGELTNVSSIFEASREALRRKNNYSTTLRTREGDLAIVNTKLETYTNLIDRAGAVGRAEAALADAESIQARLSRMNDLIMTLSTARTRLKVAQEVTAAPLPDVQPALDLYARTQRLTAILMELRAATDKKEISADRVGSYTESITALDEEYEVLLHEAGTCPTCGQSTEGVHYHATA